MAIEPWGTAAELRVAASAHYGSGGRGPVCTSGGPCQDRRTPLRDAECRPDPRGETPHCRPLSSAAEGLSLCMHHMSRVTSCRVHDRWSSRCAATSRTRSSSCDCWWGTHTGDCDAALACACLASCTLLNTHLWLRAYAGMRGLVRASQAVATSKSDSCHVCI